MYNLGNIGYVILIVGGEDVKVIAVVEHSL